MIPKKVSFQLSVDEVQALLELVENQLFRVKHIDRRIPGFKSNPEMLAAATTAVQTLKETFSKAKGFALRTPA